MCAGGKATLQSIGKGEAFTVKNCLIRSKERMHPRKGLWKFFFFHKPFTRLFEFFVHLFPVEETQQCVWVPGKLSFQEGKNPVESLF